MNGGEEEGESYSSSGAADFDEFEAGLGGGRGRGRGKKKEGKRRRVIKGYQETDRIDSPTGPLVMDLEVGATFGTGGKEKARRCEIEFSEKGK